MKKPLLLTLALIGGGIAPAATAATRYVPISHSYQLVEGAKYAVGAVGTNAANSTNWTGQCPRFFSRGTDGNVTVAVHEDRTTFDDTMLWSMMVHADRSCTCSGANHPHPERVVSMHQDGHYIVQSAKVNNDIVLRNGTSSLATKTAADNTTEIEFVAVPVPDAFTSTTPLFVIHGGRNENESFYRNTRAIKYDGAFDRYTAINELYLGNDGKFTTYFEVYLQIDDENPAAAAEALWQGKLIATADTFLVRLPHVTQEATKALADSIAKIPLPAVTWRASDLEAQIDSVAKTAGYYTDVKARIDSWMESQLPSAVAASYNPYHLSGLCSAEDVNVLSDCVRAISFSDAADSAAFVAACKELAKNIGDAETAFWTGLDGVQVGIKFDRLNAYITSGSGVTVYAPSTFSVAAIWHLQHVDGNKFKFYNPVAKGWLGYTTTHIITHEEAEAAIFTIDLFTGTDASHANTLVITNTAISGANNCVHKSASGTGMIVFNNSDQGSALRFVRGASALRAAYAAVNAVPSTHPQKSSNFDAAIAEANYDKKYAALQEYVNSLTSAAANADNTDDDALAAIRAYDKEREKCMVYIKLTPTENSSCTMHYTTNHSTSGANTLMYFDGGDETEANSIWIYSLGKLTNYSNGLRAQTGKGGAGGTHFGMCTTATDNAGEALRFFDGHNAPGTVQIGFGNDRGLHIHTWNGHLSANACGTTTGTHNHTEHNLNIELVKSLPVEIHSDGWGSFYSPIAFSVPENSGCTKFYAGKIEGESLVLTEGTCGSVYAGGTALLIKGTPNSTIHVSVEYAATDASADYTGAFEGTTIAAAHSLAQTGQTSFAKSAPAESAPAALEADEIVNLSAVGESAPVNTLCYTVADTHADIQGSVLPLNVTKMASGIERVEVRNLDGTVEVYDLAGRRLAAPVRGLNIINGRKVLVK